MLKVNGKVRGTEEVIFEIGGKRQVRKVFNVEVMSKYGAEDVVVTYDEKEGLVLEMMDAEFGLDLYAGSFEEKYIEMKGEIEMKNPVVEVIAKIALYGSAINFEVDGVRENRTLLAASTLRKYGIEQVRVFYNKETRLVEGAQDIEFGLDLYRTDMTKYEMYKANQAQYIA